MQSLVIQDHSPDVMDLLLKDKRSANTRRAYQADLKHFFNKQFSRDCTPETIQELLTMNRGQLTMEVLQYKGKLLEEGLAESTVNRRISAIKSLVNYAYRIGKIDFQIDIPAEKVKQYRDTRGTDKGGIKNLLAQPNRTTVKGKRDYAILLLLAENALRRAEVVSMDVQDYHPWDNAIMIIGKGSGTQKERITISEDIKKAINEYLETREPDPEEPLFMNCDRARKGTGRISGDAVYYIVNYYSKKAGFEKPLAPHKIRHTAITAALDAGVDIRKVKKLSRHSKMETLMIYDDNRTDQQGEVTNLLSMLYKQ